jgi:hypothetical protein
MKKILFPSLLIAGLFFASCGSNQAEKPIANSAPVKKYWLDEHAQRDMNYTKNYLVRPKLKGVADLTFTNLDFGIEDTDAKTISCAGHVLYNDGDGGHNRLFVSIFKADSLGQDKVLSFKMKD